MTNTRYQIPRSPPLAAVMAGHVVSMTPKPDDVDQTMPPTPRRSTNPIRPAYRQGNTGLAICAQVSLTGDSVVDHYRPRTELGRKLIALRRAYITTGGQLLNGEGLDAEMRLRSGGVLDA